MLLRSDLCDFKFSPGTDGRVRVFTIRRSSGTVRWSCGLDELKSSGAIVGNTYQGSFARLKGADYELYNILAIPVGTLKNFSFEQVNTEREYQVVTKQRTLQCRVMSVESGGKLLYPVNHRQVVIPTTGNIQTLGGAILGIGDPGTMKSTRR